MSNDEKIGKHFNYSKRIYREIFTYIQHIYIHIEKYTFYIDITNISIVKYSPHEHNITNSMSR